MVQYLSNQLLNVKEDVETKAKKIDYLYAQIHQFKNDLELLKERETKLNIKNKKLLKEND